MRLTKAPVTIALILFAGLAPAWGEQLSTQRLTKLLAIFQ